MKYCIHPGGESCSFAITPKVSRAPTVFSLKVSRALVSVECLF